MKPPTETTREISFYYTVAQTGLEMVVPIGVGWVIDHYAGSSPWGIIVGAVIGLVVGLTHLVTLTNQAEKNRRDKAAQNETQPPQ